MTVFVKQWLDCEFVRTLSTGKELRYRMFLSTGGELYAVVDLNGTSRRVWPDGYGGYFIVMRCIAFHGKIRIKAKGEPWPIHKADGYQAFLRGFHCGPPAWMEVGRRRLWREGWLEGYYLSRKETP